MLWKIAELVHFTVGEAMMLSFNESAEEGWLHGTVLSNVGVMLSHVPCPWRSCVLMISQRARTCSV